MSWARRSPADRRSGVLAVLQRCDQGEGRLGSLVGVASPRGQAVEATPAVGVVEGDAGVVVAVEPADGADQPTGPPLITGQLKGARAGIGQGRGLDRLLVKCGPVFVRPPPSGRSDRQMAG